jgi:hypothetical protein
MQTIVRCPACAGLSRIPPDAIGLTVHCPRCDESFVARKEPSAAPPRRRRLRQVVPSAEPAVPVVHPIDEFDSGHDHGRHGPTSALIGLSLLPLGIPLVWAAARLLTGIDPVFSYALPVAIAVGMAGLCLGAAVTCDWSYPTRVKGILMLVFLGYAAGAFLFFVQKDWLEAARKRISSDVRWQRFEPADKTFEVQVPGRARPEPAAEPVPGWELRTFRCADPKQKSTDVYWVAYGLPPDSVANLADNEWFAAVRQAITQAAGGVDPSEKPLTYGWQQHPGREYGLVLPDRITNRTVRVYRIGTRAFYLAAEGVALPADAPDVRKFFESFYLKMGK